MTITDLSPHIRIDERHPQLTVISFRIGPLSKATDERFEDELDRFRRWLARCQTRTITISDLRGVSRLTASQRKHFAICRDAWAADLQRVAIAVAYIVPNPLIRGALIATSWFRRVPVPMNYFSNFGDALTWLAPFLTEEGLELTRPLCASEYS